MTTVYAVATGSYSDYSIRAIFSQREYAEKYIAKMEYDRWAEPQIEEWILDYNLEWLNSEYNTYRVFIYKNYADTFCHLLEEEVSEESVTEFPTCFVYIIRAKDKQHAAKIAMERRSQDIIKDELEETLNEPS